MDGPRRRLHRPLGNWLLPWSKLHRRWDCLFSASLRQLFLRDGGKIYQIHTVVRLGDCSRVASRSTSILPPDAVPVDHLPSRVGLRVLHHSPLQAAPAPSPPASTLDDFIHEQPTHLSELFHHLDLCGNSPDDICDACSDLSDVVIAPDGGAIPGIATEGVSIATTAGRRLVKIFGPVSGNDPPSCRAELAGLKCGLAFLLLLFQFCQRPLPSGSPGFHSDNQGMVKKFKWLRSCRLAIHQAALHADSDLLLSILHLMAQFPDKVKLEWVKGHQDRNCASLAELPLPARLNIEADSLATAALEACGEQRPFVPMDPVSKVMLDVNGVTVTSNVTHTLHCILQLPALRDHYLERFKWSWETFESMDWMSFHQAFKNKKRHAFLVKLGFKKLPVGERIHRWADHYDSRCPHCLLPDETDDHLFQCVHPSRSNWRTSFLDSVRDSAEDWDPTLLDILLAGLSSCLHNAVFDPSSWSDPTCQKLLSEQNSIG